MPSLRNVVLAAAASAGSALAATQSIKVGDGGITFQPNVITAAKGDTLQFHFYAQNHSVVMGTKGDGCQPATSGGFFSGFMPVSGSSEGSKVFEVTVNSTETMYIYCSQAKHCQGGMVAVINGDSTNLAAYKSSAANATKNTSPDSTSAFGGTVVAASSASSGNSSSSGSGSSSATSSGSTSTSTTSSDASGAVRASIGLGLGAVVAALMLA